MAMAACVLGMYVALGGGRLGSNINSLYPTSGLGGFRGQDFNRYHEI